MKIKIDKKTINDDLVPFTIMEVPLSDDIRQECYSYYSMDAPTEFKRLILEEVAEAFDSYILNGAPEHIDKNYLIEKLNKVKIKL